METQRIHAAALKHGVAVQALDGVTASVQAHFGDETPRPVDLASFIAVLPTWDKIGMPKEQFDLMPVSWRLSQGRAFHPPVERHRPYRPAAPEEMLKEWAHFSLPEQATAYRAWADQQPRD
jgi:hypothetical protein